MRPVRRSVADTTRRLVHRFYDQFWNARQYGIADRLVAPHGLLRGTLGATVQGPQGLVEYARELVAAFPDIHLQIDELIVDRDRAAARVSLYATHQGELFGCAPTGRAIRYDCVVLFRTARGRITEVDVHGDRAELWRQMAAPGPGPMPRHHLELGT